MGVRMYGIVLKFQTDANHLPRIAEALKPNMEEYQGVELDSFPNFSN